MVKSTLHRDPLLGNGHWFSLLHRGPLRGIGHRFFLHQGPLLGNGHWFSLLHRDPLRGTGHRFLYIKALCKAMVIDFLVASRPFARQWSSISLHQDPLLWNGHWFSLSHWDPLRGTGHRFLYIKALCKATAIDFLFTSRPSTRQWLSISLYRDPLPRNGRIHR